MCAKFNGQSIELGTHLHLISFIAEVNNHGIYHITELGSYFTFMFLMGYHITELGSHFTFMFLMGYHYFLYRNYK